MVEYKDLENKSVQIKENYYEITKENLGKMGKETSKIESKHDLKQWSNIYMPTNSASPAVYTITKGSDKSPFIVINQAIKPNGDAIFEIELLMRDKGSIYHIEYRETKRENVVNDLKILLSS